mgnify:FL=1
MNVLEDLRRVGPRKPLGYLPISTIQQVALVGDVVWEAVSRGLNVLTVTEEQSRIRSGAVVIYDRTALAALLDASVHILLSARWPTDPETFVWRVMCGRAAPAWTALFDLIADAFADTANVRRMTVKEDA